MPSRVPPRRCCVRASPRTRAGARPRSGSTCWPLIGSARGIRMFFEGFTLTRIEVPGGSVRLRHGGSGPPLVLLHGNPPSHCIWNVVGPAMAKRFTVICPDLRGYGESHKPPVTPDHAPYAKREMAKDVIAVMDHFGHQHFRVAGHDRGGRVAHRLALDDPDRVMQLATL